MQINSFLLNRFARVGGGGGPQQMLGGGGGAGVFKP